MLQCCVNVKLVSNVTPNIFGYFPSMCIVGHLHLWMYVVFVSFWYEKCYCRFVRFQYQFVVVDVVAHLRRIYVEAIDLVSHHWSGCVDVNVIGVLDQLDVRRRCWKVGQIVIEERRRQNSTLYYSCFHLSAIRLSLPKMNFDSSVLHIVVEPATDCCRYVGVEDTI